MTKRPTKLLAYWIAISSAILIAGIILFILLGFNMTPEMKNNKTVEVSYGVTVEITTGAEEKLQDTCEKAFDANGLKVLHKNLVKEIDSNSGSVTGDKKLVYTFSSDATDKALEAARVAIDSAKGEFPDTADIFVSVHGGEGSLFGESIWRGAIALVVGAIVVLVYIGVRFGIGAALTGLTACVHDSFVTLAILAITRIPVYAFVPLLYAGVAAVVSLLLWLVQCIKMRENFKEPSYKSLSAEEAVAESWKTALFWIIGIGCAIAAAVVVCGAVATAGVRMSLLPALVPVAVALYSSLLFAPALHVHVKAAFDKLKLKNKRYIGKAKEKETND